MIICNNPPLEYTTMNVRVLHGLARSGMAQQNKGVYTIDWDKLQPYIYDPGLRKYYEGPHSWGNGFRTLGTKSWQIIQEWYKEYKGIDDYDFSI